jgi:hypothetical protein
MRKPTVDEHSAAQSSSLPVNFPPGVDLEIRKNRFLAGRNLGFLIITPLYFMFALISKNDPPPITHPGFFTVSWASPWFGN